jgi:hypothetical protein
MVCVNARGRMTAENPIRADPKSQSLADNGRVQENVQGLRVAVHHLLLAPLVEIFQRLRHRHPPRPRHRLHGGPGECDDTLPGRGTGEREAVSETAYGTTWEEQAPCRQESARPPPGISSQATAAHLPASCRRPPPSRSRCLLAHRRGPPPCRSPPPASSPP